LVNVVACDDGRVEKLGRGYTVVACILWSRSPLSLELNYIRVDGLEASSTIASMVLKLSLKHDTIIEAILVDSLTIAGFNIISPPTIKKLTGIPLIAIYKYKPSSHRLEEALRKHFKDWDIRMRVLREVDKAEKIETRKGELYIYTWSIDKERAREIIENLQVHSRIPEPLRLAHKIASEIALIKQRLTS